MPSADVNSAELLQQIENVLKGLSKDKTINNTNLRNLSVHYRDKKQNNIPIIYEELIKLSPILEMNKSLKLLKVLPSMFDMLQRAMQTAYNPVLKQQQETRQKLSNTIENIIALIRKSHMDSTKKEHMIEDMKKIKNLMS